MIYPLAEYTLCLCYTRAYLVRTEVSNQTYCAAQEGVHLAEGRHRRLECQMDLLGEVAHNLIKISIVLEQHVPDGCRTCDVIRDGEFTMVIL